MKVEPKTGKATIDFLLLSYFMFQFLHFLKIWHHKINKKKRLSATIKSTYRMCIIRAKAFMIATDLVIFLGTYFCETGIIFKDSFISKVNPVLRRCECEK